MSSPLERRAAIEADRLASEITARNRAARARRAAPPIVSKPDGIVRLRCSQHGVIEERIAYSSIPLRLNGCAEDGKEPCQVRIESYDWERDIA